jgi:nucleoside-diphosphate-sugar epimerase
VNLGNPIEHTVLEIARMVLRVTGSASSITHHSLPVDDPKRRCPDIRLARDQLDWEPVVEVMDGLERTVKAWRITPPEENPSSL